MAIEDSYPGVVVEWGGGYWGSPSVTDIEPLAVVYQSLVSRNDYVADGLRREAQYVHDVGRKMSRHAGWDNTDGLNSWKALRLQVRRSQLEADVLRRFDERQEQLREFVRTYIVGSDQLVFAFES